MGQFKVKVRLAAFGPGPNGKGRSIELLVDTGATYTTIPRDILSGCGVPVTGQVQVKLADGSLRSKDYGPAIIEVEGKAVGTTVLFGESGDLPLLGVTTLEVAALGVDPVARRLVPIQAIQA